jgi:renalase
VNEQSETSKVAVVGAGIAGAAVAHALTDAGHAVHVFDKSGGVGGRMATRRMAWTDTQHKPRVTAFDHGAPSFSAKDTDFRAAVEQAVRAGVLTTWWPRLHPLSLPWPDEDQGSAHFLAAPSMTRWCRLLLEGSVLHLDRPVDAVQRGGRGWAVHVGGVAQAEVFDGVVLALPPAQAAPLLAPHQREWAQRASLAMMQPCWTLMGVTAPIANIRLWDMARPEPGVLGVVLRNESRPGREVRHDEVHWVVHAKAGWSRAHVDQEPAWVESALRQALAEWLDTDLRWACSAAHRWRHAAPHGGRRAAAPGAWWDDALRLGVCGDFLGGAGVEGAWLSAQSLLGSMLGIGQAPASDTIPARAMSLLSDPAHVV